jgi:hypothetical protein
MDTLTFFALLGLIVNRGVDFLRNAFDKDDKIPKAWWLLIAWGLGIILAFIVCNMEGLSSRFGLPGKGCTGAVLVGMGLGSVAGFWHELLDRLGGAPAPTPKGLLPRSGS